MKDPNKMKAREQAQLAKLQKEQKRSNYSWYFTGLLVCLILLVILDSFSTNCPNSLQSAVVNEFFVQGQGMSFQEGLSRLSLAKSPLMLLSILATLMLAVSDRVGGKPMLLISAVGMTAGMLWVGLSQSFGAYIVGSAMITFFVSFDMHQLYIVEVSPADKRGTWQALSQFFGQLAVASVGVMRLLNTENDQIGLLMNESAPTGIRGSVTAAAGLIQVVIAIAAMVFAGIMVGFVDVGIFCVVYGAVILLLATLFLIFKVRETKGVDMDQIV